MQLTGQTNRNLFRDRELLKILCNSPRKFIQILEESAKGVASTLENVVESVCEEAERTDNGMIDADVRSPSKQQRKEASQLDPGTVNPRSKGMCEDGEIIQ